LGLRAERFPIKWTHLIGTESLNTEKLGEVLCRKRPSTSFKVLINRPIPNRRGCYTSRQNSGYVDLGHIDLLVNEGFYSNRTDLIRTAIRNQLAAHADAVKKSIVRQTLELGSRFYSRADLEAVKAAGGKLNIQVVGLATIAGDVTPELALAAIESITVLGALQASKPVKAALEGRIR